MNLKSGVTIVEPEDVDRLESEAASEGAVTYRFSTKGATEGSSFFDAVRRALPLDPPLVGSRSWDALSDSLWSGIYELDVDSVVIFWTDSSDYRNVAPAGYPVAMEILKDITGTLTDQKLTVGKPKQVSVYVS